MDDLSRFCCQNSQCPDYAQRGAANLTVCMRYGKRKQLRLLYCRTCQARFSERKGTPLFQSRLPEEKCLSLPKTSSAQNRPIFLPAALFEKSLNFLNGSDRIRRQSRRKS